MSGYLGRALALFSSQQITTKQRDVWAKVTDDMVEDGSHFMVQQEEEEVIDVLHLMSEDAEHIVVNIDMTVPLMQPRPKRVVVHDFQGAVGRFFEEEYVAQEDCG